MSKDWPTHSCGNGIAEYPRRNCQDWSAHTIQPEHASYRGWSCYICNGPCSQPCSDLPRCEDVNNNGVNCQLHINHRQEKHRAIFEWL